VGLITIQAVMLVLGACCYLNLYATTSQPLCCALNLESRAAQRFLYYISILLVDVSPKKSQNPSYIARELVLERYSSLSLSRARALSLSLSLSHTRTHTNTSADLIRIPSRAHASYWHILCLLLSGLKVAQAVIASIQVK